MKERLVSIYVCAEVKGKVLIGLSSTESALFSVKTPTKPLRSSQTSHLSLRLLAHIPRILEILPPRAGTTPNIVPAING